VGVANGTTIELTITIDDTDKNSSKDTTVSVTINNNTATFKTDASQPATGRDDVGTIIIVPSTTGYSGSYSDDLSFSNADPTT